MAKRPTPKQKHPRESGRKRYARFQYETRKRLENSVNLVSCGNCKQMKLNHFICPTCGYYKGRQLIDMSKDVKEKITKVSA